MVRAIRHPGRLHPDVNRIAGITAAITFNAALLMLLLVPISAPPSLTVQEVPYRWILPAMRQPKPDKPMQVPVTKAQPRVTPQVTPPRPQTQPVVDQIVDAQGTLPADPPVELASVSTPSSANAAPIPGVRLEYLRAPAPAYPRDALREGIQGTVTLQVLVDVDGRPLQVLIQRSSGNRQLDIAARRQVLEHWTFRPAMQDGRAVQAIGLVPIAFDLER